jgi:hypothetical protein
VISSNQYLFWSGVVYFFVGMFDIFVYRFVEPEVISMFWCLWLCLPVFLPIGGIVRGAPLWRNK